MRLLGALLGTRKVAAASPELRARMRGQAFDSARIATLDRLLDQLLSSAPPAPRPADLGPRSAVLPFVEAYFSNFIEGTEFAFDEAPRSSSREANRQLDLPTHTTSEARSRSPTILSRCAGGPPRART